jgi:hypothetical protein
MSVLMNLRFRFGFLLGLVLCTGLLAEVRADEMQLKAQLIWGANQDKPDKPYLKDVSPQLRGKLKMLKWRNFFEVLDPNYPTKSFKLPQGETKKLKLSARCEIEVTYLGDSKIRVELFGEGRSLNKTSQPMSPGQLLVLAGEDKNDTAWCVVLTALNP